MTSLTYYAETREIGGAPLSALREVLQAQRWHACVRRAALDPDEIDDADMIYSDITLGPA